MLVFWSVMEDSRLKACCRLTCSLRYVQLALRVKLVLTLCMQTYHVESVCILTKVGEARSQVEQAAVVTAMEEDDEEIPEALTVE